MKNLLKVNKPIWKEFHRQSRQAPSSIVHAFVVKSPETGERMRIVATAVHGWDHVSVSLGQPGECDRCPTWGEMDFVKRMLFDPAEPVIQIHPPESDHVSIHDYCLHFWKPHDAEIPLPPPVLVA